MFRSAIILWKSNDENGHDEDMWDCKIMGGPAKSSPCTCKRNALILVPRRSRGGANQPPRTQLADDWTLQAAFRVSPLGHLIFILTHDNDLLTPGSVFLLLTLCFATVTLRSLALHIYTSSVNTPTHTPTCARLQTGPVRSQPCRTSFTPSSILCATASRP